MPRSPILDATAPIPPYTPGENPYILRSESALAGRSILGLGSPDFDSYVKVSDTGISALVSPAQMRTDINAEPALGNPSTNGYILTSTTTGARSWQAPAPTGIDSFDAQSANTVFAGPASGAPADPTFRALVAADIPATLNNTTVESATVPTISFVKTGTTAKARTFGIAGAAFWAQNVSFSGSVFNLDDTTKSGWLAGLNSTADLFQLTRFAAGSNPVTGVNFLTVDSAGKATFSGDVQTTNLLTAASTFNLVNATPTTVNFAGAATTLNIGSTASGSILLKNPTVSLSGTLLQPVTAYNTNIGSLSKKFLALHAAELWVETIVAQDTMATIGGRILVGPTTSLIADLSTGATTIDVKHNNLANGDRIYMESNGQVEFMAVTSSATTITGGYRYSVTRNLDGTGANQWFAGDAVFNTGQTGSGFIDLYSARGVKAASEVGPTIVGNVRNSSTYNDWSARWAIGNLQGLYDYGSLIFGAAFGRQAAGNTWVAVDATNGFRVMNNATLLGQWDTSGNVLIGQTTGNLGNVFLTSAGVLSIRRGTTDYITLSATDAQFTNLIKMTGANAAMSLGTTPPTSATVGTGIWLDRTGIYSLSSNVQNATLTSTGLTAGGGLSKLDASGLTLSAAVNIEGTTASAVKWLHSTTQVGHITGVYDSGLAWTAIRANMKSADTTGQAIASIDAYNDTGATGVIFALHSKGSASSANADKTYARVGGNGGVNFLGFVVGSPTAVPAYMLDVYGTGRFQDTLTAAGNLTVTGVVTDDLEISAATGGILRLASTDTTMGVGDLAGKIEFYKADASAGGVGVIAHIDARATEATGGLYVLDFWAGSVTSLVHSMTCDNSAAAGETRLLVWDVNAGSLKRVSVGAADSGGAGFKVLRIPN